MSDANRPIQPRIEFSVSETSNTPGEVTPYSEPVVIPEVLVDGLASLQNTNGLFRLTFFVERADVVNAGQPTRPVVARLAMTSASAAAVASALTGILHTMVDQNLIPPLPEVTRK